MKLLFPKTPVAVFFILFMLMGTAHSSPSEAPLPAGVVRELFLYLLDQGTNIAKDVPAQNKWLSKNLRKSLAESAHAVAEARKLPEVDGPDPREPDNDTLLDAWDHPTACDVQDALKSAPLQIHVVCHWGPETNYPGTAREAIVFVEKEDGMWRIANIQWHKNEYSSESDVMQGLASLKAEAENLIKKRVRP